jgi:tRNA dimethylallyltransferase
MTHIVALVGATATGKTDLGEALAGAIDGEIVCCDSRQVFRELEVGTGKPTAAERARRPHHLFDALGVGGQPSAGWYAAAVHEVCARVHARGRTPVLVGGSGLYLSAAQHGLAEQPPRDSERRARLNEALAHEGPEALHHRLAALDPAAAARLAPRDRQRIVRALEIVEGSGRPLAWWRERPRTGGAGAPPAAWRVIELVVPAATLAERIAVRTHAMFEHGLIEEARGLLERGLGPALGALRAVGYDEAVALLEGRLDRAQAEARTTLRTRQLAKRQRTWFRHQVHAARLDASTAGPAALLRAALELAAGTE